jgi:hypothetical protein
MLVLKYAANTFLVFGILMCGACHAFAGQEQAARGHCMMQCKMKYLLHQDPAHPPPTYWHCINRCIAIYPLPNRNFSPKPVGN